MRKSPPPSAAPWSRSTPRRATRSASAACWPRSRPTNGVGPGDHRRRARGRGRSDDGDAGSGTVIEIEMPAMGESVSEGTILEWAKSPGDSVAEDETIVEISTDKVDAEVPAPASGTLTEVLAEAGDTVTVGQVIARMTSGNGAAPAKVAPKPEADRDPTRRRHRDDPHARGPEGHAGRAARRRRAGRRPRARSRAPARNGRIGKADVLAFKENGATAAPAKAARADRAASRPCSRARARCSRATWTSRGRSRPRRPSAPSPSPTSTRAASSSRTPATASPSRT